MNQPKPHAFIGIDVQIRRPCAFVVLDAKAKMVRSGWIEDGDPEDACNQLATEIDELGLSSSTVAIGIDAPRKPLTGKRPFFWDRKQSNWRPRRPSERGWGRHCEVVVKSTGIGNPQWTPPGSESPPWMKLGFGLFLGLENRGFLSHEVFPSAAYSLLDGVDHDPIQIQFSAFHRGVKDMADACMAAFVVHEFHAGRGDAVGADGLGQIVLPRPIPKNTPEVLLQWPREIRSVQADD